MCVCVVCIYSDKLERYYLAMCVLGELRFYIARVHVDVFLNEANLRISYDIATRGVYKVTIFSSFLSSDHWVRSDTAHSVRD